MNTDNRQETGTVSEADLGWVAGILDGEGSITMLVSARSLGRRQAIRLQCRIIVGNTDEGIIAKYASILDRLGITQYVQHTRPKPVAVNGRSAYKAVTTIHVEGLGRVRKLLSCVIPHLAGEKREKSIALLNFIKARLDLAEIEGKAGNLAYTANDVENILAFLRLTKTKQLDRVTRLLREHTREARQNHRKALKRKYAKAAAERGYIRPSRRAPDLQETARSV